MINQEEVTHALPGKRRQISRFTRKDRPVLADGKAIEMRH